MLQPFQPERFASAAQRFKKFFEELREAFVEREEILTQCALALLSREHVLMTGPPGTAKSQMANAVLGRVIDESTGRPSLFARQFTENTVQTDLVGPINFKTLMESGRTEHFTDEGMLGAVHAFLDEVFDGRDMLLRSTLNLLHERELKQGAMTTIGQIECAFMTSNRYIAEVLESSRETLLAFVDRIAFVSFVPRGFADPKNFELVIRRHGGGLGRHRLAAPLSIQDLDVLQHAVDLTYVPDAICDSLAQFIRALDDELAAAMRADPNFQPTRYFSTRSAVRAARVLRAIAVCDKIMYAPRRDLQVRFSDLNWLRLHLLLAGLSAEKVAQRMEQESDPRERRQLDIMRTEAEIFDRCLAKLPPVEVPASRPKVDLDALRTQTEQARSSGDPDQLVAAAHDLISATESGASGAEHASRLLVETVGALSEQALRAGLTPVLSERQTMTALIESLSEAADNLERAAGTSRPMARWLRGRLIEIIDESLRLTAAVTPESAECLAAEPSRTRLTDQIDARLSAMEAVSNLRQHLDASGAWIEQPDDSEAAWRMALGKLERELALLCDALFRDTAKGLLTDAHRRKLSDVLGDLVPAMQRLDAISDRFDELGGDSQLKKRVVGPRIEPLVEAVFGRMDARDRRAVIDEVKAVIDQLARVGLDDVVEPSRFVTWVVPALSRADSAREREDTDIASLSDYMTVRDAEDPLSLVETLVEVAVHAVPAQDIEPEKPREATHTVTEVVRGIPDGYQKQVISLDVARVERMLGHLERWWSGLRARQTAAASDPAQTVALIEDVAQSGFLRVMRSDAEPLRLALEVKNLAEVFPGCAERADALRARIESLDTDSTQFMIDLLEGHAQRAWNQTLAPGDGDA